MTNLTTKENEVLLSIIQNDYQTYEPNDPALINSPTWTFVCEDSGYKGKTLSGIISSLTQKGLVSSHNDGNDSTIYITEEGFNALNQPKTQPQTVDQIHQFMREQEEILWEQVQNQKQSCVWRKIEPNDDRLFVTYSSIFTHHCKLMEQLNIKTNNQLRLEQIENKLNINS
jgi:DNA-binding MarR family transcriptional regulator